MTIKIMHSAAVAHMKIYECAVYDDNKKEVKRKKISAKPLRDKGVIKRFPSVKKAEKYLNTDEGLEFFEKIEDEVLI